MLVKRLEELTSFNPYSESKDNVRKLCEAVKQELAELGLRAELLEYNGFSSLYAHTQGSKHSRLLLQAHIDVVPGANQPFRRVSNKLYGRGVYDMLYAAACYIELLHDIRSRLPALDLGIMLSGDEELGGYNGVKSFLENGYTADVCFLPDAGEGFGSLSIGAKGSYSLELIVNGAAHHGSRPWEGDGAAAKLVHFISKAEELFDLSDKHNSTMTVARVKAGDSENKGPAKAYCTLDIRYKDKTDLSRIKKELDRLYQEFDVEILGAKEGSDYQLNLSNPYVKKFVKYYQKASGVQLKFTRAHGSSDARFFAERNIPVIMLRPDGGGAHGDNEWISEDSINRFYSLLKDYALDIAPIDTM